MKSGGPTVAPTHAIREGPTLTLADIPRAGEVGEPTRKWYIIPRVVPVPPQIEREDAPATEPVRTPEREPAQVPA
jgi:hypothetical protein